MLIHISSSNGVDEVCRAIWYFKKWLEINYEFEVINLQEAKCKNGIKSLLIQSNDKVFFLKNKNLDKILQERWKEGKCVERGDEILVFEGKCFKELRNEDNF